MSGIAKGDAGLILATVGLVQGTFSGALPSIAQLRDSIDDHGHLEASVKQAAITSGVFVATVALVTGSRAVLIVGAGAIGMLALSYKTAVSATP